MIQVIYFSPTGGTKRIALYASQYLTVPTIDITNPITRHDFNFSLHYKYIIFCLPVYAQNIPEPVRIFLKSLKADFIIFLVTYGGIWPGNVLREAAKLLSSTMIGAALIPTKHTYSEGEYFEDYGKLDILLNRINGGSINKVSIPKLWKNPFANIFPNLRARIGIKIKKNNNCLNCNICTDICPVSACKNGIIGKGCLRCLSCYYHCPHGALTIRYSKFLKLYLKRRKTNKIQIF